MDESDYFWRLVNTPAHWQGAARDFVCGANLLKKDYYKTPRLGFARRGRLSTYAAQRQRHTSPRSIIVLFALAIENLMKAIIVACGKDPIRKSGELERWFATHDLHKLAQHAGLEGLDRDRLDQLTDFITSGKYPAGRRDREGARAHGYFPENVLVGIEELLPILEARLAEIPTKRDKLAKTDLLKLCAGRKLRHRA